MCKMVRHFIILSSSYSQGQRIALDVEVSDKKDVDVFQQKIEKIKGECGEDTSISIHSIAAPSAEWSSVEKEDSFFENVLVLETVEEFIRLIQIDRKLSGVDVAKYVLSQMSCTHLKLQKLVYFCFADYLCRTQERLFQDEIYACDLGPVIKSVREKFKEFPYIDSGDEGMIMEKPALRMPVKSRILFAEKGLQKLRSVDKTIDIYGGFSARQLVELTHREGTPWQFVYHKTMPRVIPDRVILERHCLEGVGEK